MEYSERLITLERILSNLSICQGWMIAKCKFSLGARKTEFSDRSPLQILKKDKRLANICIHSFVKEDEDLLEVTLIDPYQTKAVRDRVNKEDGNYPFKVTRKETDLYLREVKDHNPIHQGEYAIVPGFLMTNKILEQISPKLPFQAKVRFLTPLQVEESAWLEILTPDEKTQTEITSKRVREIHLKTSQHIILKAEITEHKE